ncbi:unnamed protein product [Rotaria sp. Silwood2]|nr:unnamed protein product [Rotaria sp. Silwood2]CAF4514247.1 unnamed protein product [Rotaria sp. Silwood2]
MKIVEETSKHTGKQLKLKQCTYAASLFVSKRIFLPRACQLLGGATLTRQRLRRRSKPSQRSLLTIPSSLVVTAPLELQSQRY